MRKNYKNYLRSFLSCLILFNFIYTTQAYSFTTEQKHKAATGSTVISYARNLLLSIVDGNFRGSWVIDPKTLEKSSENIEKIQKSFDSLGKVKIGSRPREVRELLHNPQETKNNGKIWIYGTPQPDGTYQGLFEVFFDDKQEYVIGIISFNQKNIVEKINVNIGDPIDKMIAAYGEPVDEKDFIEDPDNKNYLGLYYLYPRSNIGFLIGQDKITKNLLVQGVLVFGNP